MPLLVRICLSVCLVALCGCPEEPTEIGPGRKAPDAVQPSGGSPSDGPRPEGPSEPPPPEPRTGDPVRVAFAAYRSALRQGDLAALKTMLASEVVAQLEGVPAQQMVELLREFLPVTEKIVAVSISGDAARITLSGTDASGPMQGQVDLVQEEGDWKVKKEHWNAGMISAGGEQLTPPQPAPEGLWSLSLDDLAPPATPATIRLGGTSLPFTGGYFNEEISMLTLEAKSSQGAPVNLMIFIFNRGEDAATGRTYRFETTGQDADKEAACHVHLHRPSEDGEQMDIKALTDGFAMVLRLDVPHDGKISGQLHLCLPGPDRDYAAGAFEVPVVQ